MLSRVDPNSWVTQAFPRSLREQAAAIGALLPPASLEPNARWDVTVDGEHLTVPRRIYNDVPPGGWDGEDLVSVMVAAVYTRHHDGWVRQRALRRILRGPSLDPWVIPFVVELVGEYVVEIIEDVDDALPDLDVPGSAQQRAFGRHLVENEAVLGRTRARVISYWNCYYRRAHPTFAHYPGGRVVAALARAAAMTTVELAEAVPATARTVTATRMLLVREVDLTGDDGIGFLTLTRPVFIAAGQRYRVEGAELVVEDDRGGVRRLPGYRPGHPRPEETEPRLFTATISTGPGECERVSIVAGSPGDARSRLEVEFGAGAVVSLCDEDAARRRR